MFRDYYLARAEAAGLLEPGKSWFVDKMPFNEVWLPLITMAFPNAKVVRIVRHPLDVCVSVMSNNLTHGFNCGYRIEDTVHHFAAVFDLVEHYRRELGHDEYLLRYESFVANQVARDPRGCSPTSACRSTRPVCDSTRTGVTRGRRATHR